MTRMIRASESSLLNLGDVMWVAAWAGQECAKQLHNMIAAHNPNGNGATISNTHSVTFKSEVPVGYECDVEVRITVDQELAQHWHRWSHHSKKGE